MGCGVDCFGIVVGRGGEGQPPRRGQMPAMAAAMRSRLRMAVGTMNQRSRLPLSERVASRVPAFSRSTITAWMVPLWRRGSMPMARTRSLQVIGPSLIRRVRIAVRMMEVSIGCGAVVFGIVVGNGGEVNPHQTHGKRCPPPDPEPPALCRIRAGWRRHTHQWSVASHCRTQQ